MAHPARGRQITAAAATLAVLLVLILWNLKKAWWDSGRGSNPVSESYATRLPCPLREKIAVLSDYSKFTDGSAYEAFAFLLFVNAYAPGGEATRTKLEALPAAVAAADFASPEGLPPLQDLRDACDLPAAAARLTVSGETLQTHRLQKEALPSLYRDVVAVAAWLLILEYYQRAAANPPDESWFGNFQSRFNIFEGTREARLQSLADGHAGDNAAVTLKTQTQSLSEYHSSNAHIFQLFLTDPHRCLLSHFMAVVPLLNLKMIYEIVLMATRRDEEDLPSRWDVKLPDPQRLVILCVVEENAQCVYVPLARKDIVFC